MIVSRVALICFILALSACDDAGGAPPISDDAIIARLPDGSRDAAQDCLLVVWDAQTEPQRDFDRAHDNVEGGAISCATGTSASEFEAALAAIRAAAAANDRAALVRELGVPLLYIDAEGNRRELTDELAEESFDEVFSPEMLAMMQNLSLDDITVVPDQGAFFKLGSLWLVADRQGGRPRLVTVNRQAFAEAAEAASEVAAQEAPTTPL